jgi:NAD(P) transhydrogenase
VRQVDLVVIGSGPAGEKGATQAAYYGKTVALVERATRVGGAPANTGGLPTKTLRETALYMTGYRRRELYGVGLDVSPELTLDRLRVRSTAISSTAVDKVAANLDRHGVEVMAGMGRLAGDGVVEVTGPDGRVDRVRGEVVLVATGSRPFRPADIPFDDPDVHDSDSILDIERIPSRVVVVGGGPVGLEYASILGALGVGVTVVDAADRIAPFLDVEISHVLADALSEMGVRLVVGSGGAEVARQGGALQVTLASGEVLTPDCVLFAAGRRGNTELLGLAEAGVALDARGRIVVDDEYRTTAAGVVAAGDVIGPPALASVSAEQGRVAVCHAFGIPFKESVDPLPPFGIYTIPEVGMVGMSEEAAARAGIDHEVGRARFADNPRSLIAGTTMGMVKLVFRRDDRRLLGVHIVGEEAAELVHVGQAVIHADETIDRFIHTTFNIPTRAEAYKYAAYDGLQRLAG